MVARIYSINCSWKYNHVSYNDTDIMTDYYHGFSCGIARTAEWIKKDGGYTITVSVTNNDPKIPALKRVQQIAKTAGYIVEDLSGERLTEWRNAKGEQEKYFKYEYKLTATPQRKAQLEAEDAEEQRKIKEMQEYAKTPQAQLKKLKTALYQAKNTTAVMDGRGFHMITPQERQKEVAEIEAKIAQLQKQINNINNIAISIIEKSNP